MNETLSELIQRRLRELNLTKSELARSVGVSRAYIGSLANATANTRSGIHRPKPSIVTSLAKHLHVSESEILTAIGYNPETQDRFDILDGVTIQFDRSVKLSEKDKETILEAVRLIAAGIQAGTQKD